MTKRAWPGQYKTRTWLSKWKCRILSDWTEVIYSFAMFAKVKLLWTDYKSQLQRSPSFYSNKSEELFIMGIQYIYLKYGKVWIASVYVKNWNLDPGKKFHAIPRFLAESFAVHIGDHLRSNLRIISGLEIICGRGSFAALYITLLIDLTGFTENKQIKKLHYTTCNFEAVKVLVRTPPDIIAFQTKMWCSDLIKFRAFTENHFKNGCFFSAK